MKNERFLYKIKRNSISEPEDLSIRRFSCLDFFTSVKTFIEKNFSGAIDIDFPTPCHGYVNVSARGFSYFVYLLLSNAYGRSMVKTKLSATESEVIVTIENLSELGDTSHLLSVAKRSGFSVYLSEDSVILKTTRKITQEAFVYAENTLELINYLYEVFLSAI